MTTKTEWKISIYVDSPEDSVVKTLTFPHRPSEAELGKAVATVFSPLGFRFTNNKPPERKVSVLEGGRAE